VSERNRIAAAYDAYSADPGKRRAWDIANPGNAAIRDEVAAAMLPLVPEQGALLDAGCGNGWWLERLVAAGVAPARLHGVELLAQRIHNAAARVPGASLEVADVRALPYGDGSFAAVFLLTVLSSMADPRAGIADAWRVLAPGGRLVVWEPRMPNPLNRSTRLITPALLRDVTGAEPAVRTLTLLPSLARRLGPRAATWYPRLAAVRVLRTHRLASLDRP
jgi:ubiquinone/menaquinone biosynthesis C-methylase UbiE